jgi:hypothetical protein
MGEVTVPLFQPSFNRSVRVVASPVALTEDAGALLLREASRRLGLDALLGALPDTRDAALVTYSLAELVRTRVLLLAQGWGDQGDATSLRQDAAFRVGVSDAAGDTPLAADAHLASQPTLSRMQHMLSSDAGTKALDQVLRTVGLRRIRAAEPKRRRLVLDIDTLPIETHGHQDGASYNTHYGCTCFQPLIVFAETGDLLAVRLRPGGNPTAEESAAFLAGVIDAAKAEGFAEVCVRMDCGFANGHMMRMLDGRGVKFITRLRTDRALKKRTETWYDRTLAWWRAHPSPDGEPRVETYEVWERAQKSGPVRRIIAVAVEPSPGELFGKRFFLCTNFARREGGSRVLLRFYRQRGTGETYIGEFVRETVPSLRAVSRGGPPGSVTMRDNNVAVLLAALAYELLHHLRRGVEKKLGEGWSICRVRERILKVATSIAHHARQVVFRLCPTKFALWEAIAGAVCPDAQLALEVTSR